MKFILLFMLKALAAMGLFVAFLILFGPVGFWLFFLGGVAVFLTGPMPRRPREPGE